MINVLLFDLDGVIANGEPFSKQLASEYGISRETTAHFFRGRFLDCLVGKADLKEALELLLPAWGWEKSTEEFLHEWFEFEYVLQQMPDVQAHEILFWDDSPGNVEIARQVGLWAEVYTGFADFAEKMDGYIISPDKLPPSDHSS